MPIVGGDRDRGASPSAYGRAARALGVGRVGGGSAPVRLDRRDHVDLDRSRAADQSSSRLPRSRSRQPRVGRLAGDDPRDVVLARDTRAARPRRASAQPHDLGAERLGEPQVGLEALAILRR